MPALSVITQVEGVNIIDNQQLGPIPQLGEGTAACVGEFADCSSSLKSDGAGGLSTNYTALQVFGAADAVSKFGGFDSTIGDFGISGGNGFVDALSNKQFAALVLVAINIASAKATRAVRSLPTNQSATNPIPVVPMQAATLPASYQFQDGSANTVRVAGAQQFTGTNAYGSGTDGALATAASGATQTFTAASLAALISAAEVTVGDILVLGVVEAAPATFSGTIGPSSTALAVTGVTGTIAVGQIVTGAGVTNGTTIVSGSGSSWVVSASQTVGPVAMTANTPNGAPGTMGAYYGTFRVEAVGGSDTLTIEQLDGTSWATQVATALAWRLHNAATADTAAQGQALNPGAVYSATQGYTVPARPLIATISAGTIMQPTTPASAPTSSSWNPLSGLAMLVQGGSTLVYSAAVQGPNPIASPTLDAAYTAALQCLLVASEPASDVVIVWCARTSATIRSQVQQTADNKSARGRGTTACVSPELNVVTVSGANSATSSTSPGVGATRDERIDYTWPGANVFVPQAVNIPIATAVSGLNTTDGNLDVRMDGFLASILSVLSPWLNPGQSAPPAAGDGGVLSVLNGFQRNAPALDITAYEYLRSQGIAALQFDPVSGPEILSGITSSLQSGQTTIMRRRMADFIQDSLAAALKPFCKLPATQALIDSAEGEVEAFLDTLLSPNDPSQQVIADYSVNANQSQVNTPAAFAQGVFVILVDVQLIPTADFIGLNTNIGTNVVISLSVGQGGVTAQAA